MANEKTVFILVRHGQTEWNRTERFRGRVDVPLNNTGLAQAEATGRRVASQWQPSAVYSSPLSRAVKTAASIACRTGREVQVHLGLIDIDYGNWQGLTPEEAQARWPEAVHDWYQRPQSVQIPGGETLDELRRRAVETIQGLAQKHTGETVVLVGHTVINRVILLAVLGLGNDRFWRIQQDTCAINVFEYAGDDFTLVSLNDTCHLADIDTT
jgi:phosphoserine phosphatase